MTGRRTKLKSAKVPLGSNAAKPEADSTTEPEPAATAEAQVDREGLGEVVGVAAPTAPPPAASLTAPIAAAPVEQEQQQQQQEPQVVPAPGVTKPFAGAIPSVAAAHERESVAPAQAAVAAEKQQALEQRRKELEEEQRRQATKEQEERRLFEQQQQQQQQQAAVPSMLNPMYYPLDDAYRQEQLRNVRGWIIAYKQRGQLAEAQQMEAYEAQLLGPAIGAAARAAPGGGEDEEEGEQEGEDPWEMAAAAGKSFVQWTVPELRALIHAGSFFVCADRQGRKKIRFAEF